MKRLLTAGFLPLVLVALAWPAASSADHVSITASVSARLKERTSSQAWSVEVSWEIECEGVGSKGASYTGNLYLVDVDSGERTYMGGVSVPTGTARQLVYVKTRERQVKPELQISCFDNNTLHGSGSLTTRGNTVLVPARNDNGEGSATGGGGGGGGSGRTDPTSGLRPGGCKFALQGTNGPDTLTGGGDGDVIFGYGAADWLRGGRGHDCLLGGRGNDTLQGGAGDDRLTGGSGRDALAGGPGTNAYDAGRGNDVVNAANHRRELVRCGPGIDRVRVDRRDRVSGCERVTRVR